jgi:hypothetical protein
MPIQSTARRQVVYRIDQLIELSDEMLNEHSIVYGILCRRNKYCLGLNAKSNGSYLH